MHTRYPTARVLLSTGYSAPSAARTSATDMSRHCRLKLLSEVKVRDSIRSM